METWHYVAIGAVVVIGGVWYVRRRNKVKAAAVRQPAPMIYQKLRAAGVKTADQPVFTKEDAEKPIVKLGTGAGGAVELSRSLY